MADSGGGRLTQPLTFVFTDVVGSTKLWAADPDGTAASFVVHDEIIRRAVKVNDGEIFGWAGDSFRAVFTDRRNALVACNMVHRELAEANWHAGPELRVRIGVTHGQALARDGEYFGPILNTAARLESVAHPGQTVVSAPAVAALDDVTIASLGRHRVRDVAEALELFQLGTSPFPPLRTVDASLSTLPPAVGHLVGRADSVRRVRMALDTGLPVTIVGTGGAGKTRLALEVAHLELSDHVDGCYFVDLASVPGVDGVAPAIAQGVRVKVSGSDPYDEVADHFRTRSALVLLDNCEHVLPAVRDAVSALRTCTDLSILTTSREPLDIAGEQLIALGPLPTAADGGPAVELFVQRVRDQSPDFEPTTTQLSQIAEICDHLDGIPLALELAASRAGVLGLDHLLEGMHDRFRVLSSSRSDGTRTLREAIDWSFGLLSEAEQDFFARLGGFTGAFDLRAAAAVAPDVDPLDAADLLHSLTRKSLVAAEGALAGRFRLLETLRAYALLKLNDRDMTDDVRRLHFFHYADVAGADGLAAGLDLDRAIELTPDWPNLSAALEWACAEGLFEEAARLLTGCLGILEDSVAVSEGLRWIERIVAQLDDTVDNKHVLRYVLSSLHAEIDDFDAVREIFIDLIDCPVPDVRAAARCTLAYVVARRKPDLSALHFEALDRMVETTDIGVDAQVTMGWTRGGVALYEPDHHKAHEFFSAGFEAAQNATHRTPNTIYVGLSLVVSQLLFGRPADALATLDSYRWGGSRWDSSPVLRAVALVDLDRSAEAAEIVFDFAHQALLGRLPRMSNDAMIGLAALALHRGESDHAWTLLQQAVTPRTPFTIGLAEGLAERIGRGEDLRRMHRGRQIELAELDAIDHLRAELARLTQAKTDSAAQTAI